MAGEILTQLNRIDSNIDAAFEKCRALGATMPSTINSDYLADTIETIPSSADIPVKTAADMTVSGATVTAPAGWYKQAASKAVPTATQATPSITVGANGLITAKVNQSEGYVSGGEKSATEQLPTTAGKTVTPSNAEQTVVSEGTFVTGDIKVAKIPSDYIKPTGTKSITENGTHDVKSFAAVEVNVAGSGGGGGAVETCTVTIIYTSEMFGVDMYLVCFTDANLQFSEYDLRVPAFETVTEQFTVAKNTMLYIQGYITSVEGQAEFVDISVVAILGDATIHTAT